MTTESPEIKTDYRPKTIVTPIAGEQPTHTLPAQVEEKWQPPVRSKWLSKTKLLLLGLATFVGFVTLDAVDSLVTRFETYPISSSLLGLMLITFLGAGITLISREWRAYNRMNTMLETPLKNSELTDQAAASTSAQLLQHGRLFAQHSYAAHCFNQYQRTLRNDMTAQEVLTLYRDRVQRPVRKQAESVLKKESIASGTLSFISPNQFMQTLVILWVSMRTVRRIAEVYGMRPGAIGNWQLLKITAQNIAAHSLVDLATDEIMSQMSQSISAKILDNSADAVAAGALNARLGKALIRLLDKPE